VSNTNINAKLTQYERPEQIFPTLSAAQIARVSALGKKRAVQAGEVVRSQVTTIYLLTRHVGCHGNHATHVRR
jgi:hypothetical protein